MEIELWTGYYDRKDRKIYEGDVLKSTNLDTGETKKLYVSWECDTWYLLDNEELPLVRISKGVSFRKFRDESGLFPSVYLGCLEIIGNIHDEEVCNEK